MDKEHKYRRAGDEIERRGRGICRECILLLWLAVAALGRGIKTSGTEEQQSRIEEYQELARRVLKPFPKDSKERLEDKPKSLEFGARPLAINRFGFSRVSQLVPCEEGTVSRRIFYTLSAGTSNAKKAKCSRNASKVASIDKIADREEKKIDRSINARVYGQCSRELDGRSLHTVKCL